MRSIRLLKGIAMVGGGAALALSLLKNGENSGRVHELKRTNSILKRAYDITENAQHVFLAKCNSQTFSDEGDLQVSDVNDDITKKISRISSNCNEKISLILHQFKEIYGTPGLVCAVSIDGELYHLEALGYSDVENGTKCTDEMVTRIASISKAFTSLGVAKLLHEGKVNLDVPIQEYVPSFPKKEVDGKPVEITLRHLLSHTSGIRHYHESATANEESKAKDEEKKYPRNFRTDYDSGEFYVRQHFTDSVAPLSLFSQDPLKFAPGTDYLYSTFAFTLIAAAIEKAAGKDYVKVMAEVSKELRLRTLIPEYEQDIVKHRSRTYQRNTKGMLENTPFVDNSYKWAGGGFLGNVHDLLSLGHCLLYAYQSDNPQNVPEYLNREMLKTLWTAVNITKGKVSKLRSDIAYALGWMVIPAKDSIASLSVPFTVYHTGAAVGASSILMLIPDQERTNGCHSLLPSSVNRKNEVKHPRGIVITILANREDVAMTDTALQISECLLGK